MSGNIFISYRRGDTLKDARALYERLRHEFGHRHVFIDLEGIEPGEDFVDTLERQLQGCIVLIALIGPAWVDARTERGKRRLASKNDFVRIELAAALQRGIKVIPVLVDNAPMPTSEQLPADLKPVARLQALSLQFQKFDADVDRLIRALHGALEMPRNIGSLVSRIPSAAAPPVPSRLPHSDSSPASSVASTRVPDASASVFDFEVLTIDGQRLSLARFRDKALLIVNTASNCGFTPQFAGLQKLWQIYGAHGLVVLGFPSNQFGSQEPGSDSEIAMFCQQNYGVSFPMMAKIEVNGPGAHPLYVWLTTKAPGFLGTTAIKWNFTKFLIGRDGYAVKRYSPNSKPESLVADIEAALAQRG